MPLETSMTRIPDFNQEMDRFQDHMPAWIGHNLKRLRGACSLVRVPAGVALIGGGVLSFLPVLGIWMLPVGFALLAHDIPAMHRPMARALDFTNRMIEKGKGKKQMGS
jgi:hypothetical protein